MHGFVIFNNKVKVKERCVTIVCLCLKYTFNIDINCNLQRTYVRSKLKIYDVVKNESIKISSKLFTSLWFTLSFFPQNLEMNKLII